MATYLTLVNYTPQGVSKIKDSPARMEAIKKSAAALGGKIDHIYVTMGRYDGVSISEFPDDAAYAKFILSVAALAFLSTETLKALSEADFRQIISSLG